MSESIDYSNVATYPAEFGTANLVGVVRTVEMNRFLGVPECDVCEMVGLDGVPSVGAGVADEGTVLAVCEDHFAAAPADKVEWTVDVYGMLKG